MSYLFDNHTCTNDLVPTPPSSYNGSMLINFNGTSNSTECQELLERAMNFSQCFNNDSTVVDCGDDRIPSVKEDTFLVRFDLRWNVSIVEIIVLIKGVCSFIEYKSVLFKIIIVKEIDISVDTVPSVKGFTGRLHLSLF